MNRFKLSHTIGTLKKRADLAPLPLFLLFALIFSLAKSKNFLPHGRFWAEEGVFFYTGICSRSFPSGLLYIFNNHLELFTNIGVYFSTIPPFQYAPIATTFYSISIWLMVFSFIFHNSESLGLKKWHVYLIFLASVGIPQSSEVWANTINLHFVFLLLNVVILLLPAPKGFLAIYSAALVFLCGLSGVPANFIAPIYIASAILERSWGRTLQSVAINTACLIQIFFLYSSGYSNERGISPEFDIIILASLTQSFWGLFFGAPGGQMAASAFGGFYTGNHISILLGASLLAASLFFFYRTFLFRNEFSPYGTIGLRNLKLLSAVAVCLVASITLSLGDRQELISRSGGGRYFWAPSILLLLMFFSHRSQNRLHKALIAFLFLCTLAGSFKNSNGPEWMPQFENITQDTVEDGDFMIWPHGWTMTLPDNCAAY